MQAQGIAADPAQDTHHALASQELFVPLHASSLHDLAGPMNQVVTMTQLLRRRSRETPRPEAPDQKAPDGGDLLQLIEAAGVRLQNLLGALQTYARVVGSPGTRRSCEFSALLAGALASLEPMVAQTGASIRYDRLPRLVCDPNQMVYAWTSLIENALKFRGEYPPEIRISAVCNEDGWLFAVRDNGIGIDPRHTESIFHMFKRINGDRYPGAGAGLAITRRIIEQHGGRIWLESEPGRGATFFFMLPDDPTAE